MSRTRNDILISAFLVLFLLWVVWEARSWPFRTRLFPWAVGFPVLALALLQLAYSSWSVIRQRSMGEGNGSETREKAAATAPLEPTSVGRRTLSIAAWTVAFALGFWLFGFRAGGPILSLVFLRFQARESWTMSVLYSSGVYLFFFLGFELTLGVPLPAGVIATSLGLQSFDSYLVNPVLNAILRR